MRRWPGIARPNIVQLPQFRRIRSSKWRHRYWTGFRGPKGDGHYDETSILTNWPTAGLRALWRQPIGGGYGSFAIANGLAFTIEQRHDLEVVSAYEVETGVEVWTNAWPASFQESMGGDGPRATPLITPGEFMHKARKANCAASKLRLAVCSGRKIFCPIMPLAISLTAWLPRR